MRHDGFPQTEYDVSIVIATKDRSQLLDQMLTSLKQAMFGINAEVIVVEGDCSDNTRLVLDKHSITNLYNETEFLGTGRHSWPQLYNFGFSKARGKWAMYASDDIVFSQECITKAINSLSKQKDEVAGGIFFYKNISSDPGWDTFGIDFTYGPKLLMNYGLVRLDYFRQVGGLDQRYKFYCADGDLCFKLYESGKQFIPLPGCFIVHNNILDDQKTNNVEKSKIDIELYAQRWRHFVSTETPIPRRLLWQEDFVDAFNLPLDLKKIDYGIEYFWHGLAYIQEDKYQLALQKFSQAMKTFQHWQLLWQSAQVAVTIRHYDIAKKAIQLVLKEVPHFQDARQLLSKLQNKSMVKPSGGTKFIILFNGRTGGTLLQKSLDNHPNIICEGEVIAYDSWDVQLQKMMEIHNRFSSSVRACGLKTKLVAIKQIDYQKFADYLSENSIRIIHLYRENPIKHALSGYVAETLFDRRKKFEIYDLADRVTPLHIDTKKFQEELLYVVEFERRLFCFVQNFDLVEQISFEYFITNKEKVLLDIQQWLGVPRYKDIIEPTKKVVPDDLSEAISNYKEFAEKINSVIREYRLLAIKKEPLFLKYMKRENIFADATKL